MSFGMGSTSFTLGRDAYYDSGSTFRPGGFQDTWAPKPKLVAIPFRCCAICRFGFKTTQLFIGKEFRLSPKTVFEGV